MTDKKAQRGLDVRGVDWLYDAADLAAELGVAPGTIKINRARAEGRATGASFGPVAPWYQQPYTHGRGEYAKKLLWTDEQVAEMRAARTGAHGRPAPEVDEALPLPDEAPGEAPASD